MTDINEEGFASSAYIKFEGKLVEDGFLDARKAAETLLGIDETIRYFIYQESNEFHEIEFEIPVRIRKGSWEALFPQNLDEILIKTALTWGAAKYFGGALEEMSKRDFQNLGFKDVFRKAFKAMLWVVKIALHLGRITKEKITNISFTNDNKDAIIVNEKGEEIQIPIEYLELFSTCPEAIFTKLMKVIEQERELVIGYQEESTEVQVRITNSAKNIFVKNDDTNEVLFPELIHGDYHEIQGHITRGNESANTIGFLYEGHILTCYPEHGNIKEYKDAMFLNCFMKGYVDRLDDDGFPVEKRPKIRFVEINIIDSSTRQRKLF